MIIDPLQTNRLDNTLDPIQQSAVSDIDGPVIIHAGPGSGKTMVIAARVARLLEIGIPQHKILCFTFTNKAADEMRSRIELYSHQALDVMWVGTFHSICCRILREYGHYAGIADFSICSEKDSRRLMETAIKWNAPYLKPHSIAEMRAEISRFKRGLCSLVDWHDALTQQSDEFYADRVREAYLAYQGELRKKNLLDFDDLVLNTVRLFRRHYDVQESVSSKFLYVCADEYQDTSDIESEVVRALSSVHGNVCVVGDINQSIFSFRGANFRVMMDFQETYKEAVTHVLDTNHRCARRLVEAAQRLIRHSRGRSTYQSKAHRSEEGFLCYTRYADDQEEAQDITREIQQLVRSGLDYSEIAVLFRLNWVSHTLKEVLTRYGVPFCVAGEDSISDAVVSHLQLIADPEDLLATQRVPATTQVRDTLPNLRAMVTCGISLVGLLHAVVDHVADSEHDNYDSLHRLWAFAAEYDGPAHRMLPDFLERLSLLGNEITGSHGVQLMTIHKSKGLEFPAVFLIGMEEGVLPCHHSIDDDESLEEERRLCYVAMTRAIDRLYVCSSRRRCHGRRTRILEESRFLAEILPPDTIGGKTNA